MTVNELIKQYPEETKELFNRAFDDGVQLERQNWEARLLDDKGTDQVIDDMIKEALAP